MFYHTDTAIQSRQAISPMLATGNLNELLQMDTWNLAVAFSFLGNGLKFVPTVKPKEKPDFVTKQMREGHGQWWGEYLVSIIKFTDVMVKNQH